MAHEVEAERNPDLESPATVPSAEAAPKVGELPAHHAKINNLAGDANLTSAFRTWAQNQYTTFCNQGQRKKQCGTGGRIDVADRMWRVALRRKTSSDQYEKTVSNVASTTYHRAVRTVTAILNSIFFDGKNLPAEYEPEVGSADYNDAQGQDISDRQNLVEQFIFDEDKRVPKIKEAIQWTQAYANCLVGIEWERRVEKRTERVPKRAKDGTIPLDDRGMPMGFKFETRERVVRDWPVFKVRDIKNCWFDAQTDDEQKWRCLIIRDQVPWEDLAAEQRAGMIRNVDKLKSEHLYVGDEDETVQQERNTNADEDTSPDATGMLDVWHVFGVVPIRENMGKDGPTGNGKWTAKVAPKRYWATYAGKLNSDKAVCLRLIRNPTPNDWLPYWLIHSHRDNKGAFHMGLPDMLEPLYWEDVTNINQAVDNKNMRNNAPMTADGPVKRRVMVFRANDCVQIGRGVQFKRLEIPDTTQTTMDMSARVENMIERTAMTNKQVMGEIAFARTSATESKQSLDQALQPVDDSAGYVADQLFPRMFELDAAYMRKYADPEVTLHVTRRGAVHDVNPTELWGPLKVKVTAVTRYKNTMVRRQELNSLVQNAFPQAEKYMGKDGGRYCWRWLFGEFGFPHVERMFPEGGDYEAHEMARMAALRMLYGEETNGVIPWSEPRPDENQAAWLEVLEPAAQQYAGLPEADRLPGRLEAIRSNIEMRKAMVAQEEARGRQGMLQAGGGGETPELVGNVTGNRIEAEEGALNGG